MDDPKVIPFPQKSAVDKEFEKLERQASEIERQRQRIAKLLEQETDDE